MDNNPKTKSRFAWQGKIYEIVLYRHEQTVRVTSIQWFLSGPTWVAHEPAPGQGGHTSTFIQCKDCHSIDVLKTTVVQERKSGLCFPFLLCRFLGQDSVDFCLLQLLNSGIKLSGHVSLKSREAGGLGNATSDSFSILQGPTVLCLYQANIFTINFWALVKSDRLSKSSLPESILPKNPGHEMKVIGIAPVQSTHSKDCLQCLALICKPRELGHPSAANNASTPPDCTCETCAYIISISTCDGTTHVSVKAEQGVVFIPDVYAHLISHIIFNKVERRSDSYRSVISVITSMKQVVVYEDGRVIRCRALPHHIQEVVMFENCLEEEWVAVLGDDGDVTILDGNHLTMKASYQNVNQMLVSDFTHCGGDQLLLISSVEFETPVNDWTHFTLTDCFSCHLTAHHESGDSVETEGSVLGAVRALENSLQGGINHLATVQCELSVKMRLVRSMTRDVYTDSPWSTGRSQGLHGPCMEGLLPLVGEGGPCMEGLLPLVGEGGPCMDQSLHGAGDGPVNITGIHDEQLSLYNQWQRVYRGRWVVGMNVKNISNRRVVNISACIASCRSVSEVVSKSQMFTFSRWTDQDMPHTADGQPRVKVPKLTSRDDHLPHVLDQLDRESVGELVVVSDVPCFDQEQLIVPVIILTWCEEQEEGGGEVRRRMTSLPAMPLTASDLLHHKHLLHLDNITQDFSNLLVLEACQDRLDLVVVSLYHTVDLADLLTDQLDMTWSTSLYCWTQVKPGPLEDVRVYPRPAQYRRAPFTLYYRGDVQLSLFIHALYSRLPDDAVMVVEEEKEAGPAVSRLLQAVLHETRVKLDSRDETRVKLETREQLHETRVKLDPREQLHDTRVKLDSREARDDVDERSEGGDITDIITNDLHSIRQRFTHRQTDLWSEKTDEQLTEQIRTEAELNMMARAAERTDHRLHDMITVVRDLDT